jgi:purine nucleoside permease
MPRAETLERVVSLPDAARLRRVRVVRDCSKFDRREARNTALKSDGHTERVGYERSTEHQCNPGFSPLSH